jgi:hypothetical protein
MLRVLPAPATGSRSCHDGSHAASARGRALQLEDITLDEVSGLRLEQGPRAAQALRQRRGPAARHRHNTHDGLDRSA